MQKAIVFDMDGVIINSEPQHYEAYVMLCKEYDVELPYEIYKGFIGGTHAMVCEYLRKDLKRQQLDLANHQGCFLHLKRSP